MPSPSLTSVYKAPEYVALDCSKKEIKLRKNVTIYMVTYNSTQLENYHIQTPITLHNLKKLAYNMQGTETM